MRFVFAWLQAARLPAQSNIAPPLLLGVAIAMAQDHSVTWLHLAWLAGFALLDHLVIVFVNDTADLETDRRNHTFTPFSGGSRVLVDGKLSPVTLARAARWAAAGLLAWGTLFAWSMDRWLAPAFCLVALGLIAAYSLPPLRISYRGGGEGLQVLGLSFVLPALGYYAVAGTLVGFAWSVATATVPFQLAGAIATSLPDVPSDSSSQKQTLAVQFGAERVGYGVVLVLFGLGIGMLWLQIAPVWWLLAVVGGMGVLLSMVRGATAGSGKLVVRVFLILSTNMVVTLGLAWLQIA